MRPRKYLENEIVQGDARDLSKYLEPDSVTLTVTSPPYRNAIDYNQHVANSKGQGNVWMRGTGQERTDAYLKSMQQVFDQVFRATRAGGFCCIVIGDEVVNGKLIPLPSLLLSRLANSENDDEPDKWRLRDMIIWHKVTSGRNGSGNRFGVFVQHAYPGYFRANIMHEYILVLQKGKAGGPLLRDDSERIPLNRIVKRELANSVWNIPPVPPRSVAHPVPFPEQIPWRLATLLTRKGDMVIDPMNGSGQTTKVAYNMGRRYFGMDVKKEYVEEARRRLKQAPRLSDYLIPVFYKESWSKDAQGGFFETAEADLSPNIPKGYKFLFRTEADRVAGSRGGIYAYYASPHPRYLCFILESSGRHYRLNLGGVGDRGSILHDLVAGLCTETFSKAEIVGALNTNIIGGDHAANACIDVLLYLEYARPGPRKGQRQYYELTPKGVSSRKHLA